MAKKTFVLDFEERLGILIMETEKLVRQGSFKLCIIVIFLLVCVYTRVQVWRAEDRGATWET